MISAGDSIPPWTMTEVDPQRMKTMAAILRDPYQVHWDRDATTAMGLGGKVINQGPLNLSYIANMLMAWQGDQGIRRLTVSFGHPVLDGDHVTAHGTVTSIDDVGDEQHASCAVWLERDGERVVTGTAVVALQRPLDS
jgi:acyl dehydratase